MIYALYRIDFIEYEAGWGCRPDGSTYHKSLADAEAFKKHYESYGDYQEYSRGSTPKLIEVSKEVYDIVQNVDSHVWIHDDTVRDK